MPPRETAVRTGIARGPARPLWLALGCTALGLAAAGAALPLLPTVPFLLAAGWAFARSSPERRARLYADPRWGSLLRDWERERAIPRGAKLIALCLLAVGWSVTAVLLPAPAPLLAGAVMLAVAAFLLTRPSPARERVGRRGGPA